MKTQKDLISPLSSSKMISVLAKTHRRQTSLPTPASHRALMHTLEAGLVGCFEQDARTPDFRRIVTLSRKLTGDNSDAIYFDAPVSSEYSYVIHGNMNQATYFSMTIEEGAADGHLATTTNGVINDTELDIDATGSHKCYCKIFETVFGGDFWSLNTYDI